LPAISPEALKAKGAELRRMRIHRRTDLPLDDLARWLNPIVSGWIQLLRPVLPDRVDPLLKRVNAYLRRWAGRRYKRLRTDKALPRVVGRAAHKAAWPIRPLAHGPHVLRLIGRAR
jgi:RNA-directed DNA polymerase